MYRNEERKGTDIKRYSVLYRHEERQGTDMRRDSVQT